MSSRVCCDYTDCQPPMLFCCCTQVPDVYGVFKYVVNYHHAGYSYINLSKQVGCPSQKHPVAAWLD